MTLSSSHIIRQQYLHAAMEGSDSEGLALQRSMSDWCSRKMTPVIERVLDSVSSPDLHVCIERLEIDVGTINLERLEQDLAEAVGQALQKQLSRQILQPGNIGQPPIPGNISYQTAQDRINQVLIHFLTTGSLPWSFLLPAGQNLEQCVLEAWQESAGNGRSPLHAADCFPVLLGSETVRKRVTRQFSSRFLTAFVTLLAPDARQVVSEILHPMHACGVQPEKIKELESCLWETVLAGISVGKTLTTRMVVDQTQSRLASGFAGQPALAQLLESHSPVVPRNPASAPEYGVQHDGQGTLPAESSMLPHCIPRVDDLLEGDRQNRSGLSQPQSVQLSPKESASGVRMLDPVRHPEVQEGIGIYIGNAGLVLLHPFLPRFFTALGIACEDRLVEPGRALCLLHYLATGQAVAPEYELALPKILCNIPLDAATESDVSLTAAELEEAAALLQAVIRHWEALRSTSPDGLRGTFLLRPGKMSLRSEDWVLQVESKSFDILLDQLPWGISMIRLPWMERMLWVEWNREC